jgi:hypothetical protein
MLEICKYVMRVKLQKFGFAKVAELCVFPLQKSQICSSDYNQYNTASGYACLDVLLPTILAPPSWPYIDYIEYLFLFMEY